MSSLHKRLVHRSTDGCCICKAKSSSSRFTASRKYEEHFSRCFKLSEQRGGDICNACVLLVKRFKKLPVGTPQHWAHVVDARAGPGVKNFVRERRRESCRERSNAYKRKHLFIPEKHQEDTKDGPKVSDFIDLKIWKKKKVCCGTIFVNAFGEAIVDPRFLTTSHNNTVNIQETIQNPLMSFENIVKKELEEVQSAQTTTLVTDTHNFKVPDRKERKDSEKSCDSKFSSDQDEGFFDRTSCSPCFEESNSQSSTASSSSMSSLTLSKI